MTPAIADLSGRDLDAHRSTRATGHSASLGERTVLIRHAPNHAWLPITPPSPLHWFSNTEGTDASGGDAISHALGWLGSAAATLTADAVLARWTGGIGLTAGLMTLAGVQLVCRGLAALGGATSAPLTLVPLPAHDAAAPEPARDGQVPNQVRFVPDANVFGGVRIDLSALAWMSPWHRGFCLRSIVNAQPLVRFQRDGSHEVPARTMAMLQCDEPQMREHCLYRLLQCGVEPANPFALQLLATLGPEWGVAMRPDASGRLAPQFGDALASALASPYPQVRTLAGARALDLAKAAGATEEAAMACVHETLSTFKPAPWELPAPPPWSEPLERALIHPVPEVRRHQQRLLLRFASSPQAAAVLRQAVDGMALRDEGRGAWRERMGEWAEVFDDALQNGPLPQCQRPIATELRDMLRGHAQPAEQDAALQFATCGSELDHAVGLEAFHGTSAHTGDDLRLRLPVLPVPTAATTLPPLELPSGETFGPLDIRFVRTDAAQGGARLDLGALGTVLNGGGDTGAAMAWLMQWVDAQPLVLRDADVRATTAGDAGGQRPPEVIAFLRQAGALLSCDIPEVREHCLHRLLQVSANRGYRHEVKQLLTGLEAWRCIVDPTKGDSGTMQVPQAAKWALTSGDGDVSRMAEEVVKEGAIEAGLARPLALALVVEEQAKSVLARASKVDPAQPWLVVARMPVGWGAVVTWVQDTARHGKPPPRHPSPAQVSQGQPSAPAAAAAVSPTHSPAWLLRNASHTAKALLGDLSIHDLAGLRKVSKAYDAVISPFVPRLVLAQDGVSVRVEIPRSLLAWVESAETATPATRWLAEWVDAQALVEPSDDGRRAALLVQTQAMLTCDVAEVRERCLLRLLTEVQGNGWPHYVFESLVYRFEGWRPTVERTQQPRTPRIPPNLASALLSPYEQVRSFARGVLREVGTIEDIAVEPVAQKSKAMFLPVPVAGEAPPEPGEAIERALMHPDAAVRAGALNALPRYAADETSAKALLDFLGGLGLRKRDTPAWRDLLGEVASTLRAAAAKATPASANRLDALCREVERLGGIQAGQQVS